jgi:thiol-disulfide isomerase/thioredoxin
MRHPRLGGREIALKNYRGHVLPVNFWATWCPPCIGETPTKMMFLEPAYSDLTSVETILFPGTLG